MSRVNSGGTSSAVRNVVELAKKAAAEAQKKIAAEAAKKKEAEASKKALAKRKDSFQPDKSMSKLVKKYTGDKSKDIGALTGGKGQSKVNRDGSQTTERETADKKGTVKQSVTTDKSLGTTKLKFESEATKKNGNSTKHTFEAERDALGRRTSSQTRETTVKSGDNSTVKSRTTATDFVGNKQTTDAESTAVVDGKKTTTNGSSIAKGAFGTSQTTDEKKVETKHSETRTSTTTTKSTKGSEFKLAGGTETKDGKFTVKNSADWKSGSSVGKSYEGEWKLKDKSGGLGGPDKYGKAQKVGDVLAEAGLKKTVFQGAKIDTDNFKELEGGKFVGTKAGFTGDSSVSIGADGAEAKYSRAAIAGAYAQSSDEVEGKYGKASYKADARVEAKASFDASAKLNANGIEATAGAKVGVTAEASINGKLETKPVKFAGVDLTAGIEGNAKVSAQLTAEATGTVKATRHPPTIIVEGKAGASAVVKAEADVKVSAGPFAVKASGYASAGAEATASGVFGYEDGKLKIGGSLGAALGVGLGGSVNVEVDVKQIGEMGVNTAKAVGKAAHDAADIDGDGKLSLKDVGAAAKKVDDTINGAKKAVATTVYKAANASYKAATTVANNTYRAASKAASTAVKTVSTAASAAVKTVSAAASTAVKTVSAAASSAVSTVSNAASSAASAAKSAVSGAASTVKGWFGW